MATAVWRGLDAHRLEIAHVEQAQGELRATGMQTGVAYELRYELEPGLMRVEVVGESRRELALDGADFFDLGLSPLFNCLPSATGCSRAVLRATTCCAGWTCPRSR